MVGTAYRAQLIVKTGREKGWISSRQEDIPSGPPLFSATLSPGVPEKYSSRLDHYGH